MMPTATAPPMRPRRKLVRGVLTSEPTNEVTSRALYAQRTDSRTPVMASQALITASSTPAASAAAMTSAALPAP